MKDNRIKQNKQYSELFSKCPKEALRIAIENRRFEIELYWKRATYFWTLIAAVFAGFFALQRCDSDRDGLAPIMVSCLGLVFTTAWHMISRASAYYHQNWDAHVRQLEDEIIGPLHKTTFGKDSFRFIEIYLPFRFSGTKIQSIVSLYVILLWLFLLLRSISQYLNLYEPFSSFNLFCVAISTSVFMVFLIYGSWPGKLRRQPKEFCVEPKILKDKNETE